MFEAFFSVLRNVSQESTVQYTLALLDEMLAMDPAREKDMHAPSPQHPGMLVFLVLVLFLRSSCSSCTVTGEPVPGKSAA